MYHLVFLLSFFFTSSVLCQELIGGREARPGELPFSVFIGNCTASVVGPSVVLTAGHCRSTGESVQFSLDGVRHTGRCVRHPQFNNRTVDNDFSLCRVSPTMNPKAMASINATNVSVGDAVLLQGFGRNRLGVLQLGAARVGRIDNQDITVNSSVKLGGGDSGGALLQRPRDLFNGPFTIIGINSRVQTNGNSSFFNRVNLNRSQSFFRAFANQNRVSICGINTGC